MPRSIERSMEAAEVSLRMEGLSVTEVCKELCRELLAGEITLEQLPGSSHSRTRVGKVAAEHSALWISRLSFLSRRLSGHRWDCVGRF